MPDAPAEKNWLATVIALGKDLVALLRDGALFLLALLLIAFPTQFNTILVNAGFEEGSIVGFKWKSKLLESDSALKDAQATIDDLQSKNDELIAALADANAKLDDPALFQRITRLEDENRRLKDTTQQVQTTVSQAIESNVQLVEKAMSATVSAQQAAARTNADYSVGLQTLGVVDADRIAINDKIQAAGYQLDPITWSYPGGQRPSWFAPRSTVFYYAPSAQRAAKELATLMKSLTGQDFAVQRGAGLGVVPSRRDTTLYIHYVRS